MEDKLLIGDTSAHNLDEESMKKLKGEQGPTQGVNDKIDLKKSGKKGGKNGCC